MTTIFKSNGRQSEKYKIQNYNPNCIHSSLALYTGHPHLPYTGHLHLQRMNSSPSQAKSMHHRTTGGTLQQVGVVQCTIFACSHTNLLSPEEQQQQTKAVVRRTRYCTFASTPCPCRAWRKSGKPLTFLGKVPPYHVPLALETRATPYPSHNSTRDQNRNIGLHRHER